MKTAKEFLNDEDYYQVINNKYTQSAMIEFAKMHVKQALKIADNHAKMYDETKNIGNDILNAYPLENIK